MCMERNGQRNVIKNRRKYQLQRDHRKKTKV